MIKRLLSCVRENKRDSILSPVFIGLEVLLEVMIPFFMASLIDNGLNKGDMGLVQRLGILLVVLAFVSLTFGALAGKYAAKASAGFAKNLREDMYYNVQNFSFSNIDKFSTASIVTRLTTDVTNVQNAYQMIIRIAVRAPLMLVFALIMAYRQSRQVSMIFLGIVPLLALGFYLIISNATPIFDHIFASYDKLNSVVQENLRGIRVVKSFVREDYEKDKFDNVSNDIYKFFVKAEKIIAYNAPLMQFAMYSCLILISWLGAKEIIIGNMATGQLMSLIAYATQILMSLMMLSMVAVMIIISKASAVRIVEILDEKSDLHNIENPSKEITDGSITFEDVSFSYSNNEEKLCLKDVNISIASGETVGIIGGTGSSKTSLVQLIPRLYDTTKGRVLVAGKDVKEYDIESLRNEVAMVLQKNVLFSGTIKENLRWGCEDASLEELVRVCKLAQADDFIQLFPHKYDTYIEQGGSNVSGGQKQRLCIARALLKKPKILILDDSTSAVDTKTDALIRKAFREEIPNTTKIIIAQRISSIQDADKIIVMEGGYVNAIGTHEELLKNNSIYQEVYYSQQKGGIGDEA